MPVLKKYTDGICAVQSFASVVLCPYIVCYVFFLDHLDFNLVPPWTILSDNKSLGHLGHGPVGVLITYFKSG